jgi:alpha-L-fucosidase
MAATAASAALPLHAQTADSMSADVPAGFDQLTEDYAQFCATPAHERVFYALARGKIVREKLDNATWTPVSPAWGDPPELPIPGGSWDGVPMMSPITDQAGSGPYKPTWDSLLQYEAPEWYRDAKFGIWAHWGPQCVPEDSDWYARNMYIQGNNQYEYQEKHYGLPSTFGYKDLCPQWTLLNWDPDDLISRYAKAGARFFLALASHHDGFDTWNSKYHEWNSVRIGPHCDVVGIWAAAARKQGLRVGVSLHQARNWWWFQPSHGADKSGPFAGVPYDGDLTRADGKGQWWEGLDPQRLYGVKHPADALPDISYVKNFYNRTRDLIDQHNPDQLFFDNALLPLGWAGMNIGAYFYNHNLQTHGGKMEGLITTGNVPPRLAKALIGSYESGMTGEIMPYPWQSETCVGNWHYDRSLFEQNGKYGGYLHPSEVIHWMIDAVSKNGTFLLNFPGKPDGTLDSKEIAVLDGITAWMQVNGEAIHATRPWKVYAEGPHRVQTGQFQVKQGNSIHLLDVQDIRFTRNKGNTVIYAIFMGWPKGPAVIKALGTAVSTNPGKIGNVQLLGTDERVRWKQRADGLTVELPHNYQPAVDFAASLKISLA